MKNGWTGGQYSVFRLALAAYLFIHFAILFPRGPGLLRGFMALGALATALLALGIFDRIAAVLILCVWACPFGWNPLIANPSFPFVGGLLLAHTLMPPAPYGSWKARGRIDPGGGWTMPGPIFLAAWVVMALGYAYGGITKLIGPSWADGSALSRAVVVLELLFAPLALSAMLRPWIWLGMVGMRLGLLVIGGFADPTVGLLLVHFFTLDPAWIPRRDRGGTETLFYDGTCALCHGAVRFALAEDRTPDAVRFAPLQGELFREKVPEAVRIKLPDSLVVVTADGAVLSKSAAVFHLLERLGGLWRLLAGIGRVFPAPVRDAVYDGVAQVRYRVFGRRDDLCPIVPAAIRSRFDLR